MNFRSISMALAATVCLLGSPAVAAGTPGLTIDSGTGLPIDGDGPWTLGWSFDVTTTQTLVGLGLYDQDGDGFLSSHTVGLWDNQGTLLTSAVVASADPLISGFRFASISAFQLLAGQRYIVGAADLGKGDGYWIDATTTTVAGIDYVNSRFKFGSGLNFPGVVGADDGYFGGNILVEGGIPEPSTWAMMIIGFGAAGSMIRRRKALVA